MYKMSFKDTLQERPIIGGVLIAVLFNVFLFLALLTQSFIYIALGEMHYLTIMWLQFSLMFGFLALLFLIIVPYGLNLPGGVQTLGEYAEAIQLRGGSPPKHNIITVFITVAIFVAFELIGGLIFAEITFDFTKLFATPQPEYLGAFAWIYALRPGIWEEIAFRGVVVTMLLKKYSKKTSVIIDGILFGLVHLMNLLFGADLIATIVQIAYASILGFFLAYMYIKTRNLLSCILTHYLIDVFGQLFAMSFTNILVYFLVVVGMVVVIPVIINSYLIKRYTERYF